MCQALACTALFVVVAVSRGFGTEAVASEKLEGATHPEEHAPRLLHDAQCTGTCTSYGEDDDVSRLDNAFFMLGHQNFENPDQPRLKEGKTAWILWYLFLMVYMFAGLAVVCDEFFVPALECFVDAFQIPMDVAGATFMAAGGSMPELFTAFIATFQESDLGFAAIVGSAVFNVLFVIAVCVVASPTALTLKAWPLARDCSFYTIALATVVFVFIGPQSKNEIEWWEAVLLLFEYVSYCVFMKFNGQIHEWFMAQLEARGVSTTAVTPHVNSERTSFRAPTFSKPSAFRKGIVQILTQKAYLYEKAGIVAVTQIKGDMRQTFERLDEDGDGALDVNEVKALLTMLGCNADTDAVRTALRRIARKGDDKIAYADFQRWYLISEARIDIEVRRVFDSFDKNGNGHICSDEIMGCLQSLGHRTSLEDANDIMREIARDPQEDVDLIEESVSAVEIEPAPKEVSFEQFQDWYSKSMFYKGKQDMIAMEADEPADCLSLEMPEGASWSGLAWYIFTYPIVAAMYCTLPDIRHPKHERNWKIAILAFALSLVWIGIFSNLLYECIIIVSNTIRIPPAVAGVTVLAAGTSIPDLLSSYIVAKQGEGDMAVSSSIGSNIFDVTVGLPLPWLFFNIIRGRTVSVQSDTLGISVCVLIVMLICVVGTVALMKWRMTHALGAVMMFLYWVFVAQDLLMQLPTGDPIIKVKF